MGKRRDKEWLFALAHVMQKTTTPERPMPESSDPPKSDLPSTPSRQKGIPANDSLTPRRREAVVGLGIDMVLAIIPGVLPVPVFWRWVIWGAAVCVFVLLLQILFAVSFRFRWKLAIGTLTAAVFLTTTFPISHRQWREEKAAALTGEITAGSERSMEGAPPLVQIGENGGILVLTYEGGQQMTMLRDAGLRIDMGKEGPEISTPIRDRQGHLIADIERNHWTVAPNPACWDKNYTKNALEVKDGGGHVVFQAILLPDRVILQGEWNNEFGKGVRLNKSALSFWLTPEKDSQLEQEIKPIFKYPSSEHWGEYIDGFKQP